MQIEENGLIVKIKKNNIIWKEDVHTYVSES